MSDTEQQKFQQVEAFGTVNGYFDPERNDLLGAFPLNNPEIKEQADETLASLHQLAFDRGLENSGEMTATLFLLGRHLLNSHSRYTFTRESGYTPEDLEEFAEWAVYTNAIFVFPDASMYNAHGVDLLAKDTPANAVPVHPMAAQRAAQMRDQLAEYGVKVAETLPPVLSEFEVTLPSPNAIRNRMLAAVAAGEIATGAARGLIQTREGEGALAVKEILGTINLDRKHLTDKEREFLELVETWPLTVDGELQDISTTISDDEVLNRKAIELSWAGTAGQTLAWVLGYDGIALMDPNALPGEDYTEFLQKMAEQPAEELTVRDADVFCSAWEQIVDIRWFVVDQSVNPDSRSDDPKVPTYNKDEQSTLYERHRAFSWLTSNHAFFEEPWHGADLST